MRKQAISYDFLSRHGIQQVKSKPVDEHDKKIIDKLIKVECLFGTVYAKVIDGVIYMASKAGTIIRDIDWAVPYLIEMQKSRKKKMPVSVQVLEYENSFIFYPTLTDIV